MPASRVKCRRCRKVSICQSHSLHHGPSGPPAVGFSHTRPDAAFGGLLTGGGPCAAVEFARQSETLAMGSVIPRLLTALLVISIAHCAAKSNSAQTSDPTRAWLTEDGRARVGAEYCRFQNHRCSYGAGIPHPAEIAKSLDVVESPADFGSTWSDIGPAAEPVDRSGHAPSPH